MPTGLDRPVTTVCSRMCTDASCAAVAECGAVVPGEVVDDVWQLSMTPPAESTAAQCRAGEVVVGVREIGAVECVGSSAVFLLLLHAASATTAAAMITACRARIRGEVTAGVPLPRIGPHAYQWRISISMKSRVPAVR